MAENLGAYVTGSNIRFTFNTSDFSTGAPITVAGTPTLTAYKMGSAVQQGTELTLTVDYDSVTGLHEVLVATGGDATFWAADNDFEIVFATGTVGGESVVGKKVARLSLTDGTLSSTAVDSIVDEVIEGTYTLRQYMRLFASVLLGKASGLATTTAIYRDTADAKARVTATVDEDGNRTAVTLDAS